MVAVNEVDITHTLEEQDSAITALSRVVAPVLQLALPMRRGGPCGGEIYVVSGYRDHDLCALCLPEQIKA